MSQLNNYKSVLETLLENINVALCASKCKLFQCTKFRDSIKSADVLASCIPQKVQEGLENKRPGGQNIFSLLG